MKKQFLWIVLTGFLGGCAMPYGLPPGQGGIPPGHGGIPPGQAKKMGPPALFVIGRPVLVVVPGTNLSVLYGVDADVFVARGIYYYYHNKVWYRASHHRGPWKKISMKLLPSSLQGKSPKQLKAKAKGKYKRGRGRAKKWKG
ncbi:MAG: hypothetical protein V3U06_01920 [Candidatus Binatia bacterium]